MKERQGMREIKFRAWNGSKIIRWSKLIGIPFNNMLNEKYMTNPPKNILELMQYTGLKDKNGTEIYEGDIIKKVDGITNETYGFVKMQHYMWKIMNTDGVNEMTLAGFVNCHMALEVIGNIYENQELLE